MQKGQNGFFIFGDWNFPYSYQKSFLLKEIYEKNQVLGKIYDEEIEEYKKKNPCLRDDLKKTFNTGL